MEESIKARTYSNAESPPNINRQRWGPLAIKAIESSSIELMKLVIDNPKTGELQLEQMSKRKRVALFNQALNHSPASALTAAMCAAFMGEDITPLFDKIIEQFKSYDLLMMKRPTDEIKTSKEDYYLFDRAFEQLKHFELVIRFLRSPKQMSTEEINVVSTDIYKRGIMEDTSPELKLLLACRLEALGKTDEAINIYSQLLKAHFCNNAMLASLIRIGAKSPVAQYELAKHILDDSVIPEIFIQPLKQFATMAHQFSIKQHSAESENYKKILATQFKKDPSLHDVAISCLYFSIYGHQTPHINAVKILGGIYRDSITDFIQKSPKNACRIFYYGYTKSQDTKVRDNLLQKIIQMHETDAQDIWVNFILGNYHLSLSKGENTSPRPNNHLQKAFDHYAVCTRRFAESIDNLYTEDSYEMISLLRKKLIEIAEIYLDRVATSANSTWGKAAAELFTHAGYLGSPHAECQLAERNNTLIHDEAKDRARLINQTEKHYAAALNLAIACLNTDDLHTILESYHHFLNQYPDTGYQSYTAYLSREKELLINLSAIEKFSSFHTSAGLFSITANSENKIILQNILLLATDQQSPMACAILWSTESRKKPEHSKRLLDILNAKGFGDRTSPIFIDIVITKLLDYFSLARQHVSARTFFFCLREALATRIRSIDPLNQAEITTFKELITLTEFTHGIFLDDYELMQSAKNLSPINCKKIFDALATRILLSINQYKFAKSVFEKPKPLIPSVAESPMDFPKASVKNSSLDNSLSITPETRRLIREYAILPTEQQKVVKRQLKFALSNQASSDSTEEDKADAALSTSAPSDDRRAQMFFQKHLNRQNQQHATSSPRKASLSSSCPDMTADSAFSLPTADDHSEDEKRNDY